MDSPNRTTPAATTAPTRALLSLEECAARVPGASVSTIRHWVASGKLRKHKPGRRVYVKRTDLAAFLGVSPEELG